MLQPVASCKRAASSTFILYQVPSNNLSPLISKRRDAWLSDLEENALIETKQFLSGVAERVLADHFDWGEQVLHVKNIILSLIVMGNASEYE